MSKQIVTGWLSVVGVPGLWNALFTEIQSHSLPYVSVDLHQGADCSITDLKTQELAIISIKFMGLDGHNVQKVCHRS